MLRSFALIALMIALIAHLAFRGSTADLDAPAYIDWYWHVAKVTREDFFDELSWYSTSVPPHMYEWGFALFGWMLASMGAPQEVFFGSVAALSLGLKVRPLLKYSPIPLLGLLWYVSFSYILLEMNAIRAGVAAGFLLLAAVEAMERRWSRYAALLFLACSFHVSALVGLLIPALRSEKLTRNTLFLLVAASIPIGYLNSIEAMRLIGAFVPKIGEYVELLVFAGVYEEINRFNTLSLTRLGLSLVLLWKFPSLAPRSIPLAMGIRAFVLSQSIYFAFASFPVVGGRFSQLLGVLDILAVPALVAIVRPRLISGALFICLCAAQLYILSIHFQLADFFYFIGEPRVVMP